MLEAQDLPHLVQQLQFRVGHDQRETNPHPARLITRSFRLTTPVLFHKFTP